MTDLTVQSNQLPATRTGGKGLFKRVAKASDFLPRLQLFSKGKWIDKRKVLPGQYGVVVGEDEGVTVYGDKIDMFVFAARAKALDRTNPKSSVVNFEDDSDIFKSIEQRSYKKLDNNAINPCMFGISFLVWVRDFGLHEYYCRSKSARGECGKLEPFMPISPQDVNDAVADGEELEEQEAQAVKIGSRIKETDELSWFIMTIHECTQPITDVDDQETINAAIIKFLAQKSTVVEIDGVAEVTEGERVR